MKHTVGGAVPCSCYFDVFAPSDSRFSNSCISAKYCPILTNHTSMKILFRQLSGDVYILINHYDWFCGPGSHLSSRFVICVLWSFLDASFYRAYLTQTQTCKHEIKTICTFIADTCKITKWICLKGKRVVKRRLAARESYMPLNSESAQPPSLLCPPYWTARGRNLL